MSPDQVTDRKPAGFQQQQLAFTAHIRDPEQNPVPEGIPDRRMAIYRELIFNGLNEQLSSNFPVLREITDDDHWDSMIRDFLVRHRARTPLFTEIAQEFLDYLQNHRQAHADDWPFLLELAHYEYVELAVAISEAEELRPDTDYDPNGDLLGGSPVLAPTAWNLSYAYPVHEIGPDCLPEQPGEQATHLVVYRDRLDEVHFLEINAVTQRLLTLLQADAELSGEQVLQQIADELQHPQPEVVIEAGRSLLAELRERNVILGSRPAQA